MFPFAWVTNIDDREPGIVIGQLGRITYYFDCSSKTERLYRAKLLRIWGCTNIENSQTEIAIDKVSLVTYNRDIDEAGIKCEKTKV